MTLDVDINVGDIVIDVESVSPEQVVVQVCRLRMVRIDGKDR